MPLTTDFSSVDQYIQAIQTGLVTHQGTDFLMAMQEVVKKFKNIPKGSRQVVLISDGEDNEDNIQKAIQLAKDEGIHIISIGVGTVQGAPIPDYLMGQLMGYKTDVNTGESIISSLHDEDLKQLANDTHGDYIDGNHLEKSVENLKVSLEKMQSETTQWVNSDNVERFYQYFLGMAIVCFLIIYLVNPKKDLNL
jgi:Ca-activated chloride channel family protein